MVTSDGSSVGKPVLGLYGSRISRLSSVTFTARRLPSSRRKRLNGYDAWPKTWRRTMRRMLVTKVFSFGSGVPTRTSLGSRKK